MSGRISYFGNVEPIIWLSFKTIKVPNAHQSANDEYLYAVENPELSEFTLHAVTPEGSYTTRWSPRGSKAPTGIVARRVAPRRCDRSDTFSAAWETTYATSETSASHLRPG